MNELFISSVDCATIIEALFRFNGSAANTQMIESMVGTHPKNSNKMVFVGDGQFAQIDDVVFRFFGSSKLSAMNPGRFFDEFISLWIRIESMFADPSDPSFRYHKISSNLILDSLERMRNGIRKMASANLVANLVENKNLVRP